MARMNKGSALISCGRLEEALVACERALALDPNIAMAWMNKGIAQGKLDRFAEALAGLRARSRIEPATSR